MAFKMLEKVKKILESEGYHVDKVKKIGKGNDSSHQIFVTNKHGDHNWIVSVSSLGGRKYD